MIVSPIKYISKKIVTSLLVIIDLINQKKLYVLILIKIYVFYFRSNSTNQSSDQQQIKMETNVNTPSELASSIRNDFNSRKRKLSIPQYKEQKRLKSDNNMRSSSTDISMKINSIENLQVKIVKFENSALGFLLYVHNKICFLLEFSINC